MNYNMEELMPIMSELARKYCLSHQSSSMTYEQAQALMEEAVRCLEERKEQREQRNLGVDSNLRLCYNEKSYNDKSEILQISENEEDGLKE